MPALIDSLLTLIRMLRRASVLAFLLAVGCDRGQVPPAPAPGVASPSGAAQRESFAPGTNWGGGSYLRSDEGAEDRDPFEPIRIVAPSPAVRGEILLPSGVRPVAVAPSLTGPEVALLLVDGAGKSSVALWTPGTERLASMGSLPEGFEGKSLARHPRTGVVYVAARSAGRSRIYAFSPGEAEDAPRVIYETPREVNRLTIGPRPFRLDADPYYRIFFAAKSADGTTSTRTITEEGKVEYQVAGPAASVESMQSEEFAPLNIPASFAAPTAIHPRGEPLLWQDQRGCTHSVRFRYQDNWHDDEVLSGIPCGTLVRIPPNGRGYYSWSADAPGVVLYDGLGSTGTPQAVQDTFVVSPGITPDGRGVLGVVSRGPTRSAIVYVPIAIPLGDVANAWQLGGNRCDQALFERNGGLFRPFPDNGPTWAGGPQLYTLYESQRYGDGGGLPTLVTTDLFWENFAAAYNGVFILQERRRAIPAFEAFVSRTAAALAGSAPSSTWAKAFAALARAQQGDSTGEAALILGGEGTAHSEVLGAPYDFSELKPRGHYTSSREMQRYFREVHYLTQLSQKNDPAIDVAPLLALPPEVRRSAMAWIDVYRPFIAPARAPLLWDTDRSRTVAPYAKHPWSHPAAFPLSWGIDNEVLESTVFHSEWPEEEQITGPGGRRLHPSGVDVAAMFGSPLGRTLLAGDFAAYPRLRPVLDGITTRRPRPTSDATLYQRWLDALAVEWADSSAFPGAPANSPVWGVKRLQTGLASWATLREATILVNERPGAAEMGEGGFETLVPEIPRGYVEPAPRTFDAIAGLYEALAEDVTIPEDEALEAGVIARLKRSAEQARSFGEMARKELRGVALSTEEYVAIHNVGGSIEHAFLLFKALGDPELALSVPEPMGRIADVAGDTRLGVLEVAVGNPMDWHQIVPYFGRRQIAVGSVYSYYEFISRTLLSNEDWRRDMARHQRPDWVRAVEAPAANACSAPAR